MDNDDDDAWILMLFEHPYAKTTLQQLKQNSEGFNFLLIVISKNRLIEYEYILLGALPDIQWHTVWPKHCVKQACVIQNLCCQSSNWRALCCWNELLTTIQITRLYE